MRLGRPSDRSSPVFLVFLLIGATLVISGCTSDAVPKPPVDDSETSPLAWPASTQAPAATPDAPADKPPPRPAVVAIVDGWIPCIGHPQLALEHKEQETLRKAAGVPDAVVNRSTAKEAVENPLVLNTFVRFNESRVVGAFYGHPEGRTGEPEAVPCDDHPTATVGRVVATDLGVCPDCLVVSIRVSTLGYAWIKHQTWIDVVSSSVGTTGSYPVSERPLILENITSSGKPVFASNGNTGAPPYDEGTYATDDAIRVTMLNEEGAYYPWLNAGADIAAPGVGTVLRMEGNETGAGTSFAAPYAAGMWARFLMEAWQAGHLERVVEDGRVRNKVLVDPLPEHPAFEDGYLDATEARDVIGAFARPETAFWTWAADPVPHPEPSYWVGYGSLEAPEWERLLSAWEHGFLATPEPGPGHRANLAVRAQLEKASMMRSELLCTALQHAIECGMQRYMEEDDWYR